MNDDTIIGYRAYDKVWCSDQVKLGKNCASDFVELIGAKEGFTPSELEDPISLGDPDGVLFCSGCGAQLDPTYSEH